MFQTCYGATRWTQENGRYLHADRTSRLDTQVVKERVGLIIALLQRRISKRFIGHDVGARVAPIVAKVTEII